MWKRILIIGAVTLLLCVMTGGFAMYLMHRDIDARIEESQKLNDERSAQSERETQRIINESRDLRNGKK